MPDDAIFQQLHDFLLRRQYRFAESRFQEDRTWISRYLAREMYIHAFNVDESDRVFAMTDPEVERAVEAMPRAATLVEAARKSVVAGGREVVIDYGDKAGVRFREW